MKEILNPGPPGTVTPRTFMVIPNRMMMDRMTASEYPSGDNDDEYYDEKRWAYLYSTKVTNQQGRTAREVTSSYPPFNFTKYLMLMRFNQSNNGTQSDSLVHILQRLKDKSSLDNDTSMEHDLRQHLDGFQDLQRTGPDQGSGDHLVFARYSLFETVLIGFVAGVLTLLTIVGNIMVLISFRIDTQLQTVSNYFLMSLAVADLAIGIISMPLYTIFVLMGYWPFGPVLCDLYLAIDYLMSNASVLNLLAISLDRYFSVIRPLTYRASRTPKRAGIMIGLAWIVSLVEWPPWIIAYPYIEGKRTVPPNDCYIQFIKSNPYLTTGTAIAAFYLPVTIMSILYYGVWRETQKRQKDLPYLQGEKNVSKKSSSSDDNSSHQSTTNNNVVMVRSDMTGNIKANATVRSLEIVPSDSYRKNAALGTGKITSLKRQLLPGASGGESSDIESYKIGIPAIKGQPAPGSTRGIRSWWYRCINCVLVDKEVIEANDEDEDFASDQVSASPGLIDDFSLPTLSRGEGSSITLQDSIHRTGSTHRALLIPATKRVIPKIYNGKNGKLYSNLPQTSGIMDGAEATLSSHQIKDGDNNLYISNGSLIPSLCGTYINKSIQDTPQTSFDNFDGKEMPINPFEAVIDDENFKRANGSPPKRTSTDNTYTIIIRLPDKGSSIYNANNKASIKMIKYVPKWCKPLENKIKNKSIDTTIKRLSIHDSHKRSNIDEHIARKNGGDTYGMDSNIRESAQVIGDRSMVNGMTASTSFYKIPLSSTKDIFRKSVKYHSPSDRSTGYELPEADSFVKSKDIISKSIIIQPYARIVTKTVTNGPECFNNDSPIHSVRSTSKGGPFRKTCSGYETGRVSPLKNCYLIRQVVEDNHILSDSKRSPDKDIYPISQTCSHNLVHGHEFLDNKISDYIPYGSKTEAESSIHKHFPPITSTFHSKQRFKSSIKSYTSSHGDRDDMTQSVSHQHHFQSHDYRDESPQPSTHLYSSNMHDSGLNSSCYTMASYILDTASGEGSQLKSYGGKTSDVNDVKEHRDSTDNVVNIMHLNKSNVSKGVPKPGHVSDQSHSHVLITKSSEDNNVEEYAKGMLIHGKLSDSPKKEHKKSKRPDNSSTVHRRKFSLKSFPLKRGFNMRSSSNRILLFIRNRADIPHFLYGRGKKVPTKDQQGQNQSDTIIKNRRPSPASLQSKQRKSSQGESFIKQKEAKNITGKEFNPVSNEIQLCISHQKTGAVSHTSRSKVLRNATNPLTNHTLSVIPQLVTSSTGGPLLVRTPKSDKSRKRRIEKKQDKKAAKTLTAILLAFIITWTPYSVLVLIGAFCLNCVPESLWAFSYYLCYINSTVNPVCYAMCNANFRRNFKRILCCQFRTKKPPPRSRAHFLANRNNPMYNDLKQFPMSQTYSLR